MKLETADSPKGDDDRVDRGQSRPARIALPKSSGRKEKTSPAMTERLSPQTSDLMG